MKKRLFCCLLTLTLLVLLPACQRTPDESEEKTFSLPWRQAELTVGMTEETLLAILPENTERTDAPSCAGEGTDRVYVCPSFRIYVFIPRDGIATVTSITLTDDSIKTDEGLSIGSTREQLIAALGSPDTETESLCRYIRAESMLTFSLRDDRITGITYSMR